MYIAYLIFAFVIGASIGSFINVISLRYGTGLSIISGRSQCPLCGVTLKWYELIPFFSFFIQRGKCSSCSAPISWRYPIVECVAGLLFVALLLRQLYYLPLYEGLVHPGLYIILFFVYYAFVWSILFVIFLYDMRHKIIPNLFVYMFIILAVFKLLAFFYLTGFTPMGIDILNLFSPFFLFVPFALLWLISGGRWIGFGDAKLAFGIGALLGFTLGASSIILAFWIGAIISILLILYQKFMGDSEGLHFSSEVPFAPFLVISALIVFFSHIDVLGLGRFLDLL